MSPVAYAEGHDAPRLLGQLVTSIAAVIYDIFVGGEDAVGKPVVAHELPDILLRVQFGALGRQGDESDIVGHLQPLGGMPSGLVEQDSGMSARFDVSGDLGQMPIHRLDVAPRQHEVGGFAFFRADRTENVGRGGPLIVWRRRPGAAFGPAPRDLVLLSDARLVGEPDLDQADIELLFARDLPQDVWETFLKASMAPGFWA